MKLLFQTMISLKTLGLPFIKPNVVNPTIGLIFLLFLSYIINSYYYILAVSLLSYFIITFIISYLIIFISYPILLKIKSRISNIINEFLEELGNFNNTILPNEKSIEELKRQKEIRDQQDIQNWRNKLREDYKKNNINTKFSLSNIYSLFENILTIIVYNLVNVSIIHLITITWNLLNTIITSDLEGLINLSIIPPIFFLRNKILDKIIKDILIMIYQYLLNLITSIITSRVKIFLTMGVAGLTIVNKPKTDKGKGKEIIKDGSEWDWKNDTPEDCRTEIGRDSEYVYISAEQRRRLTQRLIQKDAEDKMKLRSLDPSSSESEPIFQDPWATDPSRNLEDPKFKMPWQIDPYRNTEDYKFPLSRKVKNTKNQQSENISHTSSDEELLSLANLIIRRHKSKLQESQEIQQTKNHLDLQSINGLDSQINPKTESFYVIAPTPTATDSSATDYEKLLQPLPPFSEKYKEVIKSKSFSKRDKMIKIILDDRYSHTPTENNQLSTPMHLIIPKTKYFRDYDFEIESNGYYKPLISKPKITNYKLKSENNREYTLTTTYKLKIEKKNNNEK